MVAIRIEDGLVPLSIAARIAYKVLTPESLQVSVEHDLAEILPVVTLALAMVAPIYRRASRDCAAEALDPGEIQQMVLHTDFSSESSKFSLALFVRRADLNTAITTLRIAGAVFGHRDASLYSRPSGSTQ